MTNRITSTAKILVTGKTPGDRRAALFEQLNRAESNKAEANAKRRAVFVEAETLAANITQAQVDAMRSGDEADLEALLARRDELVGEGGQLLGLSSRFDGLDNGVPAGGLLGAARHQEAVAMRAIREVENDLATLYFEERAWFRREAEARINQRVELMRTAQAALSDADAMSIELRDLCGHVVGGHRRAGHANAHVWIGELVGARNELDRALESTQFTGLDD